MSSKKSYSFRNLMPISDDLQELWAIFETFCLNSGNAKLKFFVEHNQHCYAKVWWFYLIAFPTFVCILIMVDLWYIRSQNTMALVLSDKLSTVAFIPFPAVTICPATKLSAKRFNFTAFRMKYAINWPNSLENISNDELEN